MRLTEAAALAIVAILSQGLSVAEPAGLDCLDTNAALDYWRPIHEQARNSNRPADALALELVSCLGSPNKELRDQIGYELFSGWLRSEQLNDDTRARLLKTLSSAIEDPPSDKSGDKTLRRSFSALILAELMRSDAQKPFASDADRDILLHSAIAAIEREDDFRGLDQELGWVHPVAHLSDLLWRFALHPETSSAQAEAILNSVKSKVAPAGAIYTFNEGDRLARIVATIISKELVDPAHVGKWLMTFAAPQTNDKWSAAFASPEGMAELHNSKQFLRALSDQLEGVELDPKISDPLDALVQGFTQLI